MIALRPSQMHLQDSRVHTALDLNERLQYAGKVLHATRRNLHQVARGRETRSTVSHASSSSASSSTVSTAQVSRASSHFSLLDTGSRETSVVTAHGDIKYPSADANSCDVIACKVHDQRRTSHYATTRDHSRYETNGTQEQEGLEGAKIWYDRSEVVSQTTTSHQKRMSSAVWLSSW